MKLAARIAQVPASMTLAIAAKAKAMKADGLDVLGFGAGEPDFDTPDHIKEAAKKALDEGKTKYGAAAGEAPLREAIARKLYRDNQLAYNAENVIVTNGGKHGLYNIFQAFLDPGDEVIIPAPYWLSYPEMVKLSDGVPVIVQTLPENNFMPTRAELLAKLTPKTKAIVLNSPSNPTGGVATRQQIKDIVSVAVQHGVMLISDEIYERLLFDGRTHTSPASLGEEAFKQTIVVNGCSKAYSMTGWRIGYLASADTELVSAMGRLQDQSTSNPTSIAQKAAVAALNGTQEPTEAMRVAFEERRNLIHSLLNAIPGVECILPGGAFYAFPNVSKLYGKHAGEKLLANSDDFAAWLLEEARVAVVPGSGFGADDYIRLSYATSSTNIEKGLARIAEAAGQLK